MIAALTGGVSPSGALFLVGRFDGTNEMLKKARAAGVYLQKRVQMPEHIRAMPLPVNYDRYAAEVRRIRGLAADAVLKRRRSCDRVWLGFAMIGHRKMDPAAWYLPAKAIEDGLTDAGFLGSDRFDVLGTMGTVCKTEEEEAQLLAFAGCTGAGVRGVLVMWWRESALAKRMGVGHAATG
jgi:hypothetical protein